VTDESITYVEARSLHESASNPRRHFDERGIEELAASIREHRVERRRQLRHLPGRAPVQRARGGDVRRRARLDHAVHGRSMMRTGKEAE